MARSAVGAVNRHATPCSASDPPEGAGIGRADRLALVEHRRAAVQQRRVDDVGMADHPADIGGAEIDLAGLRRRRGSASTRRARRGGRRCRAPRPSACRSCRRCRGCRAGRWRRPARRRRCAPAARAAATVSAQSWSRSGDEVAAHCGPLQDQAGLRLVRARPRSPRRAAACRRRSGSARCRRRRRAPPSAPHPRSASPARWPRSRRTPPNGPRRAGRRPACRTAPRAPSACRGSTRSPWPTPRSGQHGGERRHLVAQLAVGDAALRAGDGANRRGSPPAPPAPRRRGGRPRCGRR